MKVLILNNITMKFHEILLRIEQDISKKIGILQETPFSMTEHQIEKCIHVHEKKDKGIW